MFEKKIKPNGTNASNPKSPRDLLVQRWDILISLSLILTLILFPKILVITPKYQVGSIATKNIKADRDFLVLDKFSTEQRRIEAENQVKPVYDYDRDMATAIGVTISNAFQQLTKTCNEFDKGEEGTISNEKKQIIRDARQNIEKTLGVTFTNKEFDVLEKHMFSPETANDTAKLISSVYTEELIGNKDFLNQNKDNGIIIRDIKTQDEEELHDISFITDIKNIHDLVLKKSNEILQNTKPDTKRVSISIAEKLIRPNLTFAKNATEIKKQHLRNNIKAVFYKVQKNEMIVREGEKITTGDIDKLDTLFKGREGKRLLNISKFIGMFLTIMLFSLILYHVFKNWIASLKASNIDLLFLGIMAIIQVLIVQAGIFTCESISKAIPLIPVHSCFYAIPFTVGAILTSILINRNTGIVFSLFSSFLITFLFEAKASIFLYSFLGCLVASTHIAHCKQRSAFFKTGLALGIVNIAIVICLSLLSGKIISVDTIFDIIMGFTGGILSGIIVSGIAPLFESLFRYTTDIKLLELANLNNPMFQQMIIEAPGTYHHSIVVASMVEAAADAINANSLIAKVSAYYHDIGKLQKPHYYIENQQKWDNKHDKLSPKMSSLIIRSHVKEGCELAKKHKLGREIIDIIRQHHGTRLISFFYEKAKKDTDPHTKSIQETDFRYPGPKPQTKEAALVLLGDVIEASSRTLTNPTPSRIRNLVEERIMQIVDEGQLNDSELTFRDLSKISESYTRILTGIFHHRIDYNEAIDQESNGKKEKNGNPHKKPAGKDKHRYLENSANPQ